MMIRERKGFTLIELIAVVFVIAILVGLSLGRYEKATERAMDAEAKTALRLIQAAQSIYKQKYGVYYENNNETAINTNLGLHLVLGNWHYETLGPTVGSAYRQSTTRSRTLVIDSTGQPRCTSGWCDY